MSMHAQVRILNYFTDIQRNGRRISHGVSEHFPARVRGRHLILEADILFHLIL